MINNDQLILELAAQFYINKDRVVLGWNAPDPDTNTDELEDYPDPNRQWYVYKDEWFNMSDSDRQIWIEKATQWLSVWKAKYNQLYPLMLQHGKSVYSV